MNPTRLEDLGPAVVRAGRDVTLVGASYSSYLCEQAAERLSLDRISAEVIDVRVLNPFRADIILESVAKTGRICVVDGGWRTAGFAAEVVARVCENLGSAPLRTSAVRITIPDAPAPTNRAMEADYYPAADTIVSAVRKLN